MTYTKIRLYTADGIRESLDNLWYYGDCSITKLQDAIEDSKDSHELLERLTHMNLLRLIFFDRETEKKIRLLTLDGYRNIGYLEITK